MRNSNGSRFAICLKNKDADDLILRKLYPVIPDEKAEAEKYIRVIDESGDDYLYPATYFFILDLPQNVERALRRTLPVAA